MGSILGDLPSFDPHNFSQLRPSDPSNPSRMVPTTYHPTHNRTLPPPHQVITTEVKNILIRSFYQRAEDKMRPKRPASEHLAGEHGNKHFRASSSAQVSDSLFASNELTRRMRLVGLTSLSDIPTFFELKWIVSKLDPLVDGSWQRKVIVVVGSKWKERNDRAI
ncbi:hypothetical protein Bca52824_027626 [Brassica carinata]|uniref:DET1- and DDB1-associated protein 1 domain-containing protein n=1 Tax=Brassica carinata TaxID=52824 RepID=A0A8X7VAU1_BRACI|nr:hypothetical protein Bca52824_027626 [Brassica carinata]